MGGMSPIFIKKCIDIAKNIRCYKLTRPKEGLTVNEQIKVLEEVFRDMRIEEEVV